MQTPSCGQSVSPYDPPLFIWMGEGLCRSRRRRSADGDCGQLPSGRWLVRRMHTARWDTDLAVAPHGLRQYNCAPAAVDGCQRDVDLSSLGFRLSHLSPRLVSRASSGGIRLRPTTNDARWVVAPVDKWPAHRTRRRSVDVETFERSRLRILLLRISLRPYQPSTISVFSSFPLFAFHGKFITAPKEGANLVCNPATVLVK